MRRSAVPGLADPVIVEADSGAVNRALVAGVGGKVAVTVFSLAVVAIATRSLGTAGFGIIAILTGLVTALGFLDLGIGNSAISTISASLSTGRVERARRDVGTALVAMAGIGIGVAVVGSLVALTAPRHLLFATPGVSETDLRASLVVFAIALALAIPGSLGSRICLAQEMGSTNNLYLVVGAAGSVAATAVCAALAAPVWAFTIAAVVVPNVALVAQTVMFTTSRRGAIRPDLTEVSWARLRVVGHSSFYFMILGACSALAFQTNTLVVAYVLDSRAAGVLGVATRVFSLVSTLFVAGLQQSWASSARAMAAGQMNWVRQNFFRVLRVTIVPVIAISAVLVVAGQPLIRLWAGSETVPPIELLVPLALWTCYNFAMTQISFLLNAANVLRPQVIIAVAMLLVSLPLAVYLTDLIGIAGSTIAVLLAHLVVAGVPFIVLARRTLSLPDGIPLENSWSHA